MGSLPLRRPLALIFSLLAIGCGTAGMLWLLDAKSGDGVRDGAMTTVAAVRTGSVPAQSSPLYSAEAPDTDKKSDTRNASREDAPARQAVRSDREALEKIRDARQAIADLGKRLRAMNNYSVNAELAWEQVLKSGEKIMALEDVWADIAPDRLRLTILSPGRERTVFYDGHRVTLWGPLNRYYATEKFSGNLADLPLFLAKEHAFELPLADLLLWGRDPIDTRAITQARYVGRDRVGHRLCDHYAFRQKDVDWQIWIDGEGDGLPCRYLIVDVKGRGNPVWQATFQFDEGVEFADGRFSFKPPKDAVKIPFRSRENPPEQERQDQ